MSVWWRCGLQSVPAHGDDVSRPHPGTLTCMHHNIMQTTRKFWLVGFVLAASFMITSCKKEAPLSNAALEPPQSVSEAIARWHSWNIHD